MNIYEKIFARLEELHISQIELSRRTGIATSTISDWRKKKINPQADKLAAICKALDMSLVDLLCDEEDIIYIGTDLPDEYSGSNYTKHIKGTIAKAKANAAQAIPEMIEIATAKTHEDNRKNKHSRQAKNGWYRYDTRFALPVYDERGDIERYNVFSARLLIRHASSGKMYLYDVLEIKKETSKSCQE
ncbi:MAG: helix-turn-helix domain-containing protein [Acetatifactor sp.]